MRGKKILIGKEKIVSAIHMATDLGRAPTTGRAGADGRDFSGGGEENFIGHGRR